MPNSNSALAGDQAKVEHLRKDILEARQQFDSWISSKERLMRDARDKHSSTVAQAHAQRHQLAAILDELKDTKKLTEQVEGERAAELDVLTQNLRALKDQQDMAGQIVNDLRNNLQQVDDEKNRSLDVLNEFGKKTSERKNELLKGVTFYKERLGLQFSQINNEKLQFIFTNIDHEDWNREFVFHVFVDSVGKYQVPFCDPAVADLDALVETLNDTNSLSGFVKTIRRRFKQHCMIV